MSSTITHPTAMRPRSESTRCRSCRAFSRTTVEEQRQAETHYRAAGDPQQRSGHRHRLYRHQVLEREMQAHAEHQEDHADLAELVGEFGIGNKTWGERADQHAGDEVAHQRRHPQAVRRRAEDECQHQTRHDRRDQGCIVRHALSSSGEVNPVPVAKRPATSMWVFGPLRNLVLRQKCSEIMG
jgi:hypothetical protein